MRLFVARDEKSGETWVFDAKPDQYGDGTWWADDERRGDHVIASGPVIERWLRKAGVNVRRGECHELFVESELVT